MTDTDNMNNMIAATMYLLQNSMSNHPNILLTYINMLSSENFTTLLKNAGVNDDVIVTSLNMKNKFHFSNEINHQEVIKLFNMYDLDIDNGNNAIDLQKIILLLQKSILNISKID